MNLKDYFKTHGVTKRYFAKKLKVDESTLYKYLNKTRMPRLDIAIMICEATGGAVTYREMLIEPLKDFSQVPEIDPDECDEDCL